MKPTHLDRCILDPRLLSTKGDTSLSWKVEERADFLLLEVHLAEQGHQQRGFA